MTDPTPEYDVLKPSSGINAGMVSFPSGARFGIATNPFSGDSAGFIALTLDFEGGKVLSFGFSSSGANALCDGLIRMIARLEADES